MADRRYFQKMLERAGIDYRYSGIPNAVVITARGANGFSCEVFFHFDENDLLRRFPDEDLDAFHEATAVG